MTALAVGAGWALFGFFWLNQFCKFIFSDFARFHSNLAGLKKVDFFVIFRGAVFNHFSDFGATFVTLF